MHNEKTILIIMNIAIILSGGTGTRFGGSIPKQYVEVGGKPIIEYCLKTFSDDEAIDKIVICLAEDWHTLVQCSLDNIDIRKSVLFSHPGESRQETIYNALRLLESKGCEGDDVVIIHDAARPLVTKKLVNDCIMACNCSDGVLPVIHVKDTIYQSTDSKNITSLLDRNQLFAGQAPECFKFGKYIAAHKSLGKNEIALIKGSSEIAYKCGMTIRLIDGDEKNFKITTKEDLSNFENIICNES